MNAKILDCTLRDGSHVNNGWFGKENIKNIIKDLVSSKVDIIELGRKYRLEPKVIQFVHPRVGKAPNLMLVEFSKDGRPELKILDPLYVYGDDGNYTEEIRKIYANEDIGE